MDKYSKIKLKFQEQLAGFVHSLTDHVTTKDGQWSIKGFIDAYKNIYTISTDTKILSKILEIHLFPQFLQFAEQYGYVVVLAKHQNYYPDISFVHKKNPTIKFAVDFKTTYRLAKSPNFCNGFTLGSHGNYFINRTQSKNIQFPYSEYLSHFCLGIIYTRNDYVETTSFTLDNLTAITSVIGDFQFFLQEKWQIASDKRGSGRRRKNG